MSILFEPIKIKNMEIKNRFVRSATYDACADSRTGHVSEEQIRLYEDIADGGVGLIITGFAYVHSSGKITPFQNSIVDDSCIAGLKKLTTAVHERGTQIAIQLHHAGREAMKMLEEKDRDAVAPSFVPNDPYFKMGHRAITENEIQTIIRAFGDAAQRSVEAGFDAIQLHGAHAYLLSQFLSPYTNRRDDKWGGSLDNRLRFHHEIYRNIRTKVGEDYPVLIKLGVEDGFSGGLKFEEGRKAAELIAQWGFDALEISQGLRGKRFKGTEYRTKINSVDSEAYFRDWCKEVKSQVNVPVMMVGGLKTFELMEEVIQEGEADFISMCRPMIKEPDIVNKWKDGQRHGTLDSLEQSNKTRHCQ